MSGYCKVPGCGKPAEGTTKLCATHNKAMRKVVNIPIKKVSDKLSRQLSAYTEAARQFVMNKRCAVYPTLKATEVHHKKGRIGPLLMNKKFWLPVSHKAHVEITNNPKWAIQKGYSLSREQRDNGPEGETI